MMRYYFTDDLRIVLAEARREARRLRHDYVANEHILLAYAVGKAPTTARLLAALGVDPAQTIKDVEEIVRVGSATTTEDRDLPYTSRTKKSLEHAMSAAREKGHSFVGIEHLLAGILREEKNIAAQVLISRNVSEQAVLSLASPGDHQ